MLTKADIEKYFIAEKHESLLFLIIGLCVILLAFILYFGVKTNVAKGAALPLLLFGLIQALGGYSVYQRSDDQRINNVYAYDMNPGQLKTVELVRMKKLNRSFNLYRRFEISGIIAGIILIIVFRNNPGKYFWVGLGLTLALMTAEFFVADLIASKRALRYTELVENVKM